MKVDLTTLSLRLNAGGVLKLRDARGLTIRALRGVLWITQEGDEKDHIVGLCERFTVTHDGLTIVQAVTQAELCMENGESTKRATASERVSESGRVRASELMAASLLRLAPDKA